MREEFYSSIMWSAMVSSIDMTIVPSRWSLSVASFVARTAKTLRP
jgi:hypothetical protein